MFGKLQEAIRGAILVRCAKLRAIEVLKVIQINTIEIVSKLVAGISKKRRGSNI